MDRIAIIGLSCLFPGARTPAEFWRNLLEQKDSRTRATEARMEIPVESCFDPRKGRPDKFYCTHGGYIHDFEMDPTGFQIPAERMAAIGLRPLEDIDREILNRFLDPEGGVPFEARAVLRTRLGLPPETVVPPATTNAPPAKLSST